MSDIYDNYDETVDEELAPAYVRNLETYLEIYNTQDSDTIGWLLENYAPAQLLRHGVKLAEKPLREKFPYENGAYILGNENIENLISEIADNGTVDEIQIVEDYTDAFLDAYKDNRLKSGEYFPKKLLSVTPAFVYVILTYSKNL